MGNGNRTRNRRSHSPVLCQLSYSHRIAETIIATEIQLCQNVDRLEDDFGCKKSLDSYALADNLWWPLASAIPYCRIL